MSMTASIRDRFKGELLLANLSDMCGIRRWTVAFATLVVFYGPASRDSHSPRGQTPKS